MNPFQTIIEQYLYTQFPTTKVSYAARFEAVSSAVLGTKQRRFGPALPPEQQVKIREVIAHSMESTDPLTFFIPWGASKQNVGRGVDTMELSALKQLQCLKAELENYGQQTRFVFRLEDLTDRFLLGSDRTRINQIDDYVRNFRDLAFNLIDGDVRLESDSTDWSTFQHRANNLFPYFYDVIVHRSDDALGKLAGQGWKGNLSQTQVQYYSDAYESLGIPKHEHNQLTASYFAATLTRVKLEATRAPKTKPFVLIAFTHPVPDNPIGTPRVYYRTIPERYTRTHRSPWLADGYLEIGDDGTCTPRVVTKETDASKIVHNKMEWNNISIHADYAEA